MPWTSKAAKKHTRKARTKKSQRQWSHVANSMLRRTGDEGRAIAAANSVVAKRKGKTVEITRDKRRKKHSKGKR